MACRKGELREEGKSRNTGALAAATSVTLGDALLFTTMCIIGMPVDVHVKDGSVYSGIFYTASIDEEYGIVLKKARMIKKGYLDANVVMGNLIETLIVSSEDLVQVVAKGVLLPSNGITGCLGGNDIEAAAGYNEYLDRDAVVVKPDESKANKKHRTQTRFSAKRQNGFPHSCTAKTVNVSGGSSEDMEILDATKLVKIEETHNVSVDGRQVGDGSQAIQSDYHNNPEFQDKRITDEVQGSGLSITSCEAQSTDAVNILEDAMQHEPKGISSGCSNALEDQGQERPTAHETECTVSATPNVSIAPMPSIDVKSESCLSASSNPYIMVPPKGSGVKRTAKESKLNPGAKIFSPSVLHHKISNPAMPNGANVSYVQGTYTVPPIAPAQEEVDARSFTPPVSVKFVPYNDVPFGHGAIDSQYAQPIIGQMVNRMQPVRYAGQYQNFQTGHTFVNPNPQNVMWGRVGPFVCMHPISSDFVQSAGGYSPAAAQPVLNPHQVLLTKHQGMWL
ncbi:hypothetical protein CDL12_28216 [Handroanthus impetiginosus]|uniref:Ataxin 2 SM domain-containing protein n=1 Tax=Handroanthus impetiginosus TaxID=429701 RepID=A0A2G9G268_9LAMI|nr:hypothetical protein CDL12_28216 [Handroanthus impetiginosus]